MDIKAFLFDLDGTLLDTALDFIAIIQHMRQQQGMPPIEPTIIRQLASSGARAMVSAGLELAADSPELEQHTTEFLQHYQQDYARLTRPFAGVQQLLDLLHQQQIPWGVATNKPQHFAAPILEQLGLRQHMACLICPEQVAQAKPAPDMLLLACQQLGIAPQQAIYLGDDQRDIQAAQQAQMPSIAVGYGYHPAHEQPQNWGADFYIATSEQLADSVKSILSL